MKKQKTPNHPPERPKPPGPLLAVIPLIRRESTVYMHPWLELRNLGHVPLSVHVYEVLQ